MTVLLLALFAAAAVLAIGSLAFTIHAHARAALAIGRQLEACSNPKDSGPRASGHSKSRIHRRRKARPISSAATRTGPTARGLRRDRVILPQHESAMHKIGRRRQFGQGTMSPGTLVFE